MCTREHAFSGGASRGRDDGFSCPTPVGSSSGVREWGSRTPPSDGSSDDGASRHDAARVQDNGEVLRVAVGDGTAAASAVKRSEENIVSCVASAVNSVFAKYMDCLTQVG